MNRITGRSIVGAVGALSCLGACLITASATPLWGLFFVVYMIQSVE